MADRICLDTNVLVDVLRNKTDSVDWLKAVENKSIIATTYINAFELYYGAFRSVAREVNMHAAETLLQRLMLLNFSKASARHAGETFAKLQREGNTVEIRDLFMASIATAEGFKLKTKNVKHFERIHGVVLEP
ncbi:MAG: type II toxin-antitoxin system VapC family toxin [Candidatus Aenigmarchaeota archaeon]|nr:type II toxin-antitoxin system VapC family toxin [Candidatus Aenigmarchaeota archaeon]